jgi:membrane protease YdiL (CAAX protease family)
VINQWALVTLLLAYWHWYRRPWSWLLLGSSTPLRFGGGMAVALLVSWLLYRQRLQILRSEKAMERTRRMIAYAEPILPHDCNESRLFKIVSVTAGVCEETLFRGFLLWYFGVWTGTAIAMILSSTVFGLGHSYQGMKQVPRTAAAGLVFACIAVASRSLWPAVLVHAALDWNSGEIGYQLLRPDAVETPQG